MLWLPKYSLLKPSPWAVQPQLTDAPELWEKCKFFIVYYGGIAYDLVGKHIISSANLSSKITPYGEGVSHSGRVEPGYSPLNPGAGTISLASYCNPDNNRVACITQRVSFNDNRIALRFGDNGGVFGGENGDHGQGQVTFFASSSAAANCNTTTFSTGGDWHVYAGTRFASGAKIYKDGVDITDASTTRNDNLTDSGTFVLGGLPGTTVIHYLRDKLWDAGFAPGLTEDENVLLGRDPWIMLRPSFQMFVPFFKATVASVTDDLNATGIATGPPVVGSPTVGQTHALDGTGVVTGNPVVGTPTIGQVHAIDATGITTGNPTVGAPTVSEDAHVLDAVGIATGNPTVGAPTLGVLPGVYNLSSTGIETDNPTVGTPTIGQVNALVATGITTGNPTVGSPYQLRLSGAGNTGVSPHAVPGLDVSALQDGVLRLRVVADGVTYDRFVVKTT